jgi:hypothetical protein
MRPLIAKLAISGSAAPKRSSAKVLAGLKYSLSASSPATKKIGPVNPLWALPVGYLTRPWPRPALIARKLMSPMWSSISNGNRGAKDVSTKPNAGEIAAGRPWLEAEIGLVKPQVIVCLGATAAQALLGPKFRVSKQRGQFIESTLAPYIMATVHPSSILRAPDDETRQVEKLRFIDDLKKVSRVLSKNK